MRSGEDRVLASPRKKFCKRPRIFLIYVLLTYLLTLFWLAVGMSVSCARYLASQMRVVNSTHILSSIYLLLRSLITTKATIQ